MSGSGGDGGDRTARLVLDARRRDIVVAATNRWIETAVHRYGVRIEPIPVAFDLRGTSAGMYRADSRGRRIRYNPLIFARYFEENLRDTVPHEVAHYVVDVLHGRRGVRPHGPQWQAVMREFGVAAEVRHDLDLAGLGVRRQRRFDYRCACGVHEVTTVRRNRMLERRAVYRCRRCGEALKPA